MPSPLFELLQTETDPVVRVVLGHFVFVSIFTHHKSTLKQH